MLKCLCSQWSLRHELSTLACCTTVTRRVQAKLQQELANAQEVALKLDQENRNAQVEGKRLRAQFQAQEDDREYLIKQNLLVKTDNKALRGQVELMRGQMEVLVTERNAAAEKLATVRSFGSAVAMLERVCARLDVTERNAAAEKLATVRSFGSAVAMLERVCARLDVTERNAAAEKLATVRSSGSAVAMLERVCATLDVVLETHVTLSRTGSLCCPGRAFTSSPFTCSEVVCQTLAVSTTVLGDGDHQVLCRQPCRVSRRVRTSMDWLSTTVSRHGATTCWQRCASF